MPPRGVLLATAHLLVAAVAMTGQAAELTPGVRVRVTSAAPRPEQEVGIVVQADADSLIFAAEEPAHAMPPGPLGGPPVRTAAVPGACGPSCRRLAWDAVANLEVWAGRHSHAGKGAGLGLAIGAAAGLLVGALATEVGGGSIVAPESRGEAIMMGMVGGMAVGLLVGTLTGWLLHTDQWEPLERPWGSAVVGLVVLPCGGAGIGVGLRL